MFRIPTVAYIFLKLICFVVVFTTGFLSTNVEANSNHCSLELEDSARVACYQSNPSQLNSPKKAGWLVLDTRSNVSGKAGVVATRTASGKVMCGDTETTATMVLTCSDKRVNVAITTGCSLGEPGEINPLQIGTGDTASQWHTKVIRNRLGLTIDDSLQAHQFMSAMTGQEEIVLLITPPGSAQFAATVELDGFDKGFVRIESACAN